MKGVGFNTIYTKLDSNPGTGKYECTHSLDYTII